MPPTSLRLPHSWGELKVMGSFRGALAVYWGPSLVLLITLALGTCFFVYKMGIILVHIFVSVTNKCVHMKLGIRTVRIISTGCCILYIIFSYNVDYTHVL